MADGEHIHPSVSLPNAGAAATVSAGINGGPSAVLPIRPATSPYPPRAALEVAAALMLDYRALVLKYIDRLPDEGKEAFENIEERGRRGIGAVVATASPTGRHQEPVPFLFDQQEVQHHQAGGVVNNSGDDALFRRTASHHHGDYSTPVFGALGLPSSQPPPQHSQPAPPSELPPDPSQQRFSASLEVPPTSTSQIPPNSKGISSRRTSRAASSASRSRTAASSLQKQQHQQQQATGDEKRDENGNACGIFYKQHGEYRRIFRPPPRYYQPESASGSGEEEDQDDDIMWERGSISGTSAAVAGGSAGAAVRGPMAAGVSLQMGVGMSLTHQEMVDFASATGNGAVMGRIPGMDLVTAGMEQHQSAALDGDVDGERKGIGRAPRKKKLLEGQSPLARAAVYASLDSAVTVTTFPYPFEQSPIPAPTTPLVAYTWHQIQPILGGHNKAQWCNTTPTTRGKPKPFYCLLSPKDHPNLPRSVVVSTRPNVAGVKSPEEWHEAFARNRGDAAPVFCCTRVGGKGGRGGGKGKGGARTWWVFMGWCRMGNVLPDGLGMELMRDEEKGLKGVCSLACVERALACGVDTGGMVVCCDCTSSVAGPGAGGSGDADADGNGGGGSVEDGDGADDDEQSSEVQTGKRGREEGDEGACGEAGKRLHLE
ncbi:hypothetical protein HK104_003495 [Borealophlyctis nickersoniae]|nr:hypothetical protein HK104_003495 [Borealophlyctis nickersoniae]